MHECPDDLDTKVALYGDFSHRQKRGDYGEQFFHLGVRFCLAQAWRCHHGRRLCYQATNFPKGGMVVNHGRCARSSAPQPPFTASPHPRRNKAHQPLAAALIGALRDISPACRP